VTWERVRFTAEEDPRIDPGWLAEQRRIMGPRWYIFSSESVLAAFNPDRPALFGSRLG
jgi:hypothetical protein